MCRNQKRRLRLRIDDGTSKKTADNMLLTAKGLYYLARIDKDDPRRLFCHKVVTEDFSTDNLLGFPLPWKLVGVHM